VEAAQAAALVNPEWRRRLVHLAMRGHRKHCQGGARSPSARSLVLDVVEQLGVFALVGVQFVRGTARYRTWREIERRPLGWASISLQREFAEIIMEALIEEMFGSD
jgi:hypothetical protein